MRLLFLLLVSTLYVVCQSQAQKISWYDLKDVAAKDRVKNSGWQLPNDRFFVTKGGSLQEFDAQLSPKGNALSYKIRPPMDKVGKYIRFLGDKWYEVSLFEKLKKTAPLHVRYKPLNEDKEGWVDLLSLEHINYFSTLDMHKFPVPRVSADHQYLLIPYTNLDKEDGNYRLILFDKNFKQVYDQKVDFGIHLGTGKNDNISPVMHMYWDHQKTVVFNDGSIGLMGVQEKDQGLQAFLRVYDPKNNKVHSPKIKIGHQKLATSKQKISFLNQFKFSYDHTLQKMVFAEIYSNSEDNLYINLQIFDLKTYEFLEKDIAFPKEVLASSMVNIKTKKTTNELLKMKTIHFKDNGDILLLTELEDNKLPDGVAPSGQAQAIPVVKAYDIIAVNIDQTGTITHTTTLPKKQFSPDGSVAMMNAHFWSYSYKNKTYIWFNTIDKKITGFHQYTIDEKGNIIKDKSSEYDKNCHLYHLNNEIIEFKDQGVLYIPTRFPNRRAESGTNLGYMRVEFD